MTNDIEDIERLKGKRFLFVDDRRITVEYYQKELEGVGQGIATTYACNLRQALNMLKPVKVNNPLFDMVLIDLHIPKIPKDWLEANGVKVSYASKQQQVKTHLQQGWLTHVLLDCHLDDAKFEKEIQNVLKGKRLRVAITTADWKAAQKDVLKHRWGFLPKPLDSALLRCWLSGSPLSAESLSADNQKSSPL